MMKFELILLVCFLVPCSLAIFGGTPASEGQFPFIAQVHIKVNITNSPFYINGTTVPVLCGGSVVSSNIIVTAAHCVVLGRDPLNPPEMEIMVTAGTIMNGQQESPRSQTRVVKKIVPHGNYNPNIHPLTFNDLAILVLAVPLTFNEYVSPIRVPAGGQVFDGDVESCGWGLNEHTNRTSSAILLKADFRILPQSVCGTKLIASWLDVTPDAGFKKTESAISAIMGERLAGEPRQICASGHNGSLGGKGDSGGPLICYTRPKKEPYLCGVTSFGAMTKNGTVTANVFTAVASFSDWINARISEFDELPDHALDSTSKSDREQQIARGIPIAIGIAIVLFIGMHSSGLRVHMLP